MEKLIRRITNIFVIALAGITGVLGLYVMFNGDKFHVGGVNPMTMIKDPMGMDITFYLTYLMLFIGAALILFFGLQQMFSNKKQVIRTLILAAVAVLVFFVCYWIAPTELSVVAEKRGVTENAYRWVGASLNLAYAMFAALILTFIGMYVYTKIKNK